MIITNIGPYLINIQTNDKGRIYSLLFSILMELFEIKSRIFLFVKNIVDICLDEISFEIYMYLLTPRYLQRRKLDRRAPPGLK